MANARAGIRLLGRRVAGRWKAGRWKAVDRSALPPGPAYPRWLLSTAERGTGTAVLRHCRRRFGPVFTLATPAADPLVVIAGAREGADWRGLNAGEQAPVDAPDGPHWRQSVLPEIAAAKIDAIRPAAAIPLLPLALEICLHEVVSRLVGPAWQASDQRVLVHLAMLAHGPALARWWVTAHLRPVLAPCAGRFFGTPTRQACRLFLREALLAQIADRRKAAAGRGNDLEGISRTGMLTALLQTAAGEEVADDGVILERADGLLSAAAEEAAVLASWVMERLHRDPALLARVRAAGMETAAGAALLDTVCLETLRLYPPRPLLAPERLSRAVLLGGYALPRGVRVMGAPGLQGRDPESFPQPEAFRPDRFLEDPAAGAAVLPFAVTSHRHGLTDDLLPMVRGVVSALLARWDWRLADRAVVPLRAGAVMVPATGVRMVPVARRSVRVGQLFR